MLKLKKLAPGLIMLTLIAGWFLLEADGGMEEAGDDEPNYGLHQNPEIIADKIARKRGERPDLQQAKEATAKGRQEYWELRTGEVPDGYYTRGRQQANRLPETRDSWLGGDKDGGVRTWDWLGPGNIGGRVRALVIDPADPLRMWLGGVNGGIWKSTSGGNSWVPKNDFMANLAVSCMVMTPDRQYLFAGTGEGFPGGNLGFRGEGIFRSGDLGETWQQMTIPNSTDFRFINRLAVHPDIDGRLYAVTRNGRLYLSHDDGSTWDPPGFLNTTGYDIKITNQTADGTPWIMVAGNGDVFLSTDDGASFLSMVSGGVASPLPLDFQRAELAFGTLAGSDPYLFVSLNRNDGEVWRSTDGGNNWTRRNTGVDYLVGQSATATNQGDYDNTIWVEPGRTGRLLVGGIDLFMGTSDGAVMTRISDWTRYPARLSAHADQHLIVPHPNYSSDSPLVYFCNDGGVQLNSNPWSGNPRSGWTNLANGLGITQLYQGAADPTGNVIMGGAQDNSFLRHTGGGTEGWFQESTGDGAYVAVNQDDPDIIYASKQNLDLRRSRNGGNSYTDIGKNIPDSAAENGSVLFIAPFMISHFDQSSLYAGGRSIWFTSDEGNNWLPVRPALLSGERCSAIEQSPSDPARLYVGYNRGTVSRTINNQLVWLDIHDGVAGMPASIVTDIAVNASDPDDVVVAFGDYGSNSLWRSFNGGVDWAVISRGGALPLPVGPVNTVTFHPQNSNWIYVGTDFGVFATEDGGANWSRTASAASGEGPANTQVNDLFWAGDRLMAATFGRGMYRTRPLVVAYVNASSFGGSGPSGTELNPYPRLQDGETAAGHGTNIIIEGGTYNETNGLLLNKRGVISNRNGSALIK